MAGRSYAGFVFVYAMCVWLPSETAGTFNVLMSDMHTRGGFASTCDLYCAYCRQREWHECIKRYCFSGFAPNIPDAGAPGGSTGGVASTADMYCAYCRQRGWHECIKRYCFGGFAPNIADSVAPSGGLTGGFGSTADMYCAYCRQRGWHECIKRYCFGGFAPIIPDAGEAANTPSGEAGLSFGYDGNGFYRHFGPSSLVNVLFVNNIDSDFAKIYGTRRY